MPPGSRTPGQVDERSAALLELETPTVPGAQNMGEDPGEHRLVAHHRHEVGVGDLLQGSDDPRHAVARKGGLTAWLDTPEGLRRDLRGRPRARQGTGEQEIRALDDATKACGRCLKLLSPLGRERTIVIGDARSSAGHRHRMSDQEQLHDLLLARRLDPRVHHNGRPFIRASLRGHGDLDVTHLLNPQSDPPAENPLELTDARRSAPQQRAAIRDPVEAPSQPETDTARHRFDPRELAVLCGEKEAAEVVGEKPARRPRRQHDVAILHLQVPDASRMRHHSTPLYEAQHRGAPADRQALSSRSETLDPSNAGDYTSLLSFNNGTKRLRKYYDP